MLYPVINSKKETPPDNMVKKINKKKIKKIK